jgi:hypothetical protein
MSFALEAFCPGLDVPQKGIPAPFRSHGGGRAVTRIEGCIVWQGQDFRADTVQQGPPITPWEIHPPHPSEEDQIATEYNRGGRVPEDHMPGGVARGMPDLEGKASQGELQAMAQGKCWFRAGLKVAHAKEGSSSLGSPKRHVRAVEGDPRGRLEAPHDGRHASKMIEMGVGDPYGCDVQPEFVRRRDDLFPFSRRIYYSRLQGAGVGDQVTVGSHVPEGEYADDQVAFGIQWSTSFR